MKNCPWFSLRSNSIESRLRSIRWGNFWLNPGNDLNISKSKVKTIRTNGFASLIELFCSLRSIQDQIFICN
ncbi:hypothetical protein ABEKA_3521 (plasmid) [Acinetobacter lwoffii]|nr:hypothetical protein ABEKA_3521 [Acinetobacter lwoffii]